MYVTDGMVPPRRDTDFDLSSYIFEFRVPGTDLLLPLKATISADRLNC